MIYLLETVIYCTSMRYLRSALLTLMFFFVLAVPTHAFTVRSGDSVGVNQNENMTGTVILSGQNVQVAGNVAGDVICAGQTVVIQGSVSGDVICAGQTISINGTVMGNIRAAGQTLSLNNKVGHNVMFFGQQLNTDARSQIDGELLFGGQNTQLAGNVSQDVVGGSQSLFLSGKFGRNVNVAVQKLILEKSAVIEGNLSYRGENMLVNNGGTVKGKTQYTYAPQRQRKTTPAASARNRLTSLFFVLLVGSLAVLLLRDKMYRTMRAMTLQPIQAFGWGLLILFAVPVIAVLLAITIIGIPVAIILMLIWLFFLMVGGVLGSVWIGYLILNRLFDRYESNLYLAVIIGAVVAFILSSIPVIGWLLAFVAMCIGMGGMIIAYRTRKQSGAADQESSKDVPSSRTVPRQSKKKLSKQS